MNVHDNGNRSRKHTVKGNRNFLLGIAGFLIPVSILLLIYAISGMMPFGGRSVMTGDCTIQYSAFLAYMRELLCGNVSAAYTFSKVLGGDMAGFLSYYLLSPFHLILPLFSNERIQEAVLVLILLKTGAAGCTMQLYLSHKKTIGWETLLFSTAYALMGYNLVYQHNIMWLDGLVFLPLIVWGIEKTAQGGRVFGRQNLLYLISLGLLLLTNYYIGYMLCIFAVLYALYYVLSGEMKTGTAPLGRAGWSALKAFAVNSCLTGGLAAVSLLPTAISLHGGKAEFRLRDLFDFTILYSPLTVWKELFAGSYAVNGDLNQLPKIYCGVFVLVFTAVYFTAKKVALREKAGSLLLLVFLYCCFLLSAFDRVWHGTTTPAGAPHRYSFVFCFFLILTAYKGFCVWKEARTEGAQHKKELRNATVLYGLFLTAYVIAYRKPDGYLLLNMLLSAALVAYILGLHNNPAREEGNGAHSPEAAAKPLRGLWRTLLQTALPLCVLIELVISGNAVTGIMGYSDREAFRQKTKQAQEYVDQVKMHDDGWYRMEQCGTTVTMNDAMLFQYNGLWSYSSCEKENTKRLAGKFGLNDRTWWIIYHDEVPAASESFLGLKYIITSQRLADGKEYPAAWHFPEENVTVYQNPYALSPGTLVETDVIKTNMDTWDVPAMENDLWKRMTGGSEDIYQYADREETVCEEHLIEYRLVVQEELPIYTCFRSVGTVENMTLWVNGKEIRQLVPEMQTYCLGTFQKGDVLTIQISNQETNAGMSWYDMYFYYERIDQLQRYSAQLQAQGMSLTEFSQDSLSGVVQNETETEKLLLLSIPADRGWTVLVDGAVQKTEPVAGGFIGVRIPPGEHVIKASFVPPGLWQGIFVSVAALCILVIGNQVKGAFGRKRAVSREVNS